MLISKKIRLEVSEQDAATLEFMQGKCRGLYNWWAMRLRDGEKWILLKLVVDVDISKAYHSGNECTAVQLLNVAS